MNQLHEDLLYVKSLVTAMGNLNQEEVQLRNQNRQIAEQLEALQQKKQTIIQQLQAENPIFPVELLDKNLTGSNFSLVGPAVTVSLIPVISLSLAIVLKM